MSNGTLNKVMLIGHTGDEVKMHYFEGGGAIGRFPLATNETYTNRTTGEKVSNTEWHNCIVRNKGAEICEKYLTKGSKVYVEGRIKTRKWQNDAGVEQYSTEIHVSEFTFLSGKDGPGSTNTGSAVDQHEARQKRQRNAQNAGDQFTNPNDFNEEDKDDLPF